MKKEIWKSVDWFDGFKGTYDVSSHGRIRRSFSAPGKSTYPGRILTPNPDSKSGYLRATLHCGGKMRREQVHRLVARAFIPGFQAFRQINHKNGNKADNRIENLEWVSARQNVLHAWKNGLCKPNNGENHGCHKISEREGKAALYLLAHGVSGKLVAGAFGLTQGNISSIKRGKTWKHLTQHHV
jgi:hypothetical protein